MELYTDTYYINRIRTGDTACFGCLFDKYSRPVYSLIVKIVQNREDAEELTQDVFLKIFKSLSSFKGDAAFSTWVYSIAYHTAISYTRKKKQETYLPLDEAQIDNVTEEEINELMGLTDRSEQLQLLDRALMQLTPEERALLLIFYKQEKSIEEISEIMGLTVSNVKVKLHRTRKKLYIIMNKEE